MHDGQGVIDQSPAQFKVVFCGRRFGKTTYGVRCCVKGALTTGKLYFWIAPSYKVANIGWKMLKKIAYQIPNAEVREADKSIIFPNGGQVDIRSAVDPDSLRGEQLAGAVFDEFAQIDPDTWPEVSAPSLIDLDGWALFIGTPKGENWASELFYQAKVLPEWAAFQMPTSTNPYLTPKAIARMRAVMGEQRAAQELDADIGASQYLVYPEVVPNLHTWTETVPEFVSYHGGMDFGGDTVGAHKSCTVIAGKTSRDELIVIAAFEQSGPNIMERQLNWTLEQEQRLAEIHKEARKPFHGVTYRADKSQFGAIQLIARMGVRVYPTQGGPDSVDSGIQLVHQRLKIQADGKPKMYWLKGVPWVQAALQRYRYPEPRTDGAVQSKNPLKVDDDTVDAVRYLVEGVDRMVLGNPQDLYKNLVARVG